MKLVIDINRKIIPITNADVCQVSGNAHFKKRIAQARLPGQKT
jgi:hypothetical protein